MVQSKPKSKQGAINPAEVVLGKRSREEKPSPSKRQRTSEASSVENPVTKKHVQHFERSQRGTLFAEKVEKKLKEFQEYNEQVAKSNKPLDREGEKKRNAML